MTQRSAHIERNLAVVLERIQRACDDAQRENNVQIVAVTKTYPASDVRILADLGITAMGENRDQEAREKASACTDLAITWHFIGQLQRNKVTSVARYAQVIESVDRLALVQALARSHASLDVLLQASLDPPGIPNRGGADPGDLAELAEAVSLAPNLTLRGVMGVAPLGEDPAAAFGRLRQLHRELLSTHPTATWVSAGMSHDLDQAIAAGATHVRIGSALLGERSYAR